MIKDNIRTLTRTDNNTRAQIRMDAFLDQQSSKTCAIFDFDECLIDDHLSSQLTMEYVHRIDDSSVDFGDHSFGAIASILQCYVGLTRREITSTCNRLAAKTRWRPYALKLLKVLISNPDYTPLIMSSGLNLAVNAKTTLGSLSIPIFACELEFDNTGICIQPSLVITADVKGRLTQNIADSGKFERVFTVGHSYGDIYMLRSGIGIALRGVSEVEDVAQYVVSGFKEISRLILTGTK